MADLFSENDAAIAATQGWALETIYDTRGFFTQAIAPPKNSTRFSTPYEATAHVLARARAGDALAIRAMQTIAASRFAPKDKRK